MTQTVPAAPRVTAAPAAASVDVPEIEPRVPRPWWRLIVLAFGALLFLFPFYYMIVGSLQRTANTALSGVIPWPGNLTLLGTLVFGVLAGYALAQLRFRGRGLVFAFMLLLLMVPFQLLIIPLYVLIVRDYGLGDSYLGMIAPFAINSTAVFIFRQFFLNLPKELFDAARIDGATELRVLTRVALPLVRPAVLTAMLLTFIGPWNEFLWPLLITKQQSMQPLTVALANYISTVSGVATNPYGAIMAGAAVLAVPVVVLVIVLGYVAFGPLGPRPAVAVSDDLRRWRRLGPVHFEYQPELDADLNLFTNKDVVYFPEAIPGPDGRLAYAMLHRPTWDLSAIIGGPDGFRPAGLDDPRPGIWISYVPADAAQQDVRALTRVRSHRLVALPEHDFEAVKIGAGPPPLRVKEGWLLIHHGVSGTLAPGWGPQSDARYSAGAMLLDPDDPGTVLARSPRPLLEPLTSPEREGTAPNVVFPTAIEEIDGQRFVFYGMADSSIGVARLESVEAA